MRISDEIGGLVLTLNEAAAYLNVSTSTIYHMMINYRGRYKSKIPAFKIGAVWRFNLEDLNEWRRTQARG
jgi:excisionase family DNA binding protein